LSEPCPIIDIVTLTGTVHELSYEGFNAKLTEGERVYVSYVSNSCVSEDERSLIKRGAKFRMVEYRNTGRPWATIRQATFGPPPPSFSSKVIELDKGDLLIRIPSTGTQSEVTIGPTFQPKWCVTISSEQELKSVIDALKLMHSITYNK
jgi:hypothetical protein